MKLVMEHVKKNFETKEVLKDASMVFEKGRIYGLLGRNGAGKTTLFNCLNEDIPIDGGQFYLDINNQAVRLRAENIGYVLSVPVVPEFLTGREFLKFFLDINEGKIKDPLTIDEYFELMMIEEEDRDRLMKDYSHGMKNKLQMLVNIIASPEVLLLDEPLTSFDIVVAEEMKELLKRIKKDHIIIFSTHIMELAMDLCDEIVILHQGKLEHVEEREIRSEAFKERIIDILKEEDNVSA